MGGRCLRVWKLVLAVWGRLCCDDLPMLLFVAQRRCEGAILLVPSPILVLMSPRWRIQRVS